MEAKSEARAATPMQQTVEVSVTNLDHLGLDAAAERRILETLKAAVEQELRRRPVTGGGGSGARSSAAFSLTIKQTVVRDNVGSK